MKTYNLERIMKNYEDARREFNNKHVGTYQIRLLLDLDFLNFYIDDLKFEKHHHCQVLNNCIPDLSVNDIVEAFEELVKEMIK